MYGMISKMQNKISPAPSSPSPVIPAPPNVNASNASKSDALSVNNKISGVKSPSVTVSPAAKVPNSNVRKSNALEVMLSKIEAKLRRSAQFMILCSLCMILGQVLLVLLGLGIEYEGPYHLALFQFVCTVDQLISLCEMRILSVAIQKV